MITLNIIPEEKKKELKMISFYLMVKNIIYLILTVVIVVATLLLSTKIILQNQFNNTVGQNYLTSSPSSFISNEIKKFKQELKESKDIQKNFIPWSHLIINLEKLSNDGIKFNLIEISQEDKEMSIRGTAKTRNNLINLEEKIKESGLFEQFEIPKSVLFQKENINFSINLKIINLEAATKLQI